MSLAKLGWLTRETEDKWLEYERSVINTNKWIKEIYGVDLNSNAVQG